MSDDNVEPDTPVAGTAGAALKAILGFLRIGRLIILKNPDS
jgi:hypothetical protein